MHLKLSAAITYGDILAALDIDRIDGIDRDEDDEIKFDDAAISADEALDELNTRGLFPEPEEPEVNIRLLKEAFAHLRKGEIAVARTLFDRVFDNEDAATAIEEILRKWNPSPKLVEAERELIELAIATHINSAGRIGHLAVSITVLRAEING